MNRVSLFIFIVFLSSCAGIKLTTNTSSQSAQQILQNTKLNTAQLEWVTANIKGKVDFDGSNLPINANLRLKKDSVIWLSISAIMGLEALRAHITPDSLHLINRLNSTYFVGNINALSSQYNLPFSFFELQDLILASVNPKEKNSYTVDVSPEAYILFSSNNQSVIKLNTNYLPLEVFHSKSDSQYVKTNYLNYAQTDSVWLPKTVTIDLQSSEKTAKATLNYSKATINRPKKLKFSIPSSYVPM